MRINGLRFVDMVWFFRVPLNDGSIGHTIPYLRPCVCLYADSTCSVLTGTTAFGEQVKRDLLEYLRAHWEFLNPTAPAFNTDVWTTNAHTVVAQQVGCNDCGVSTCALADFLAADQVHCLTFNLTRTPRCKHTVFRLSFT